MMASDMAAYFTFLDDLRDSGVTNMWGAGAYLQFEYDLDRKEAGSVLVKWMTSFDSSKSPEQRAAEVEAI